MYRYSGHALLLVLGALFIFHSPFTRWWSEQGLPWYTVFVLWLVLIVLIAIDNAFSSSAGESSTAGKSSSARENNSGGESSSAGRRSLNTDTRSKLPINKDDTKFPGDADGD